MKNKGFTLVEILVVIVLLGIIIMLVAPSVLNTSDKTKDKVLKEKITGIELSAASWAGENYSKLVWTNETCAVEEKTGSTSITVDTPCETTTTTLRNLVDQNYYSLDEDNDVKNPVTTESMLNNQIIIKKYYGSYYGEYQE